MLFEWLAGFIFETTLANTGIDNSSTASPEILPVPVEVERDPNTLFIYLFIQCQMLAAYMHK